jgi:hypothetical protein
MSDNESFGFTKFVPGFDFLQNIAKGATQSIPQLPSLSNWVAPTLNVEELEKRIAELKAVHFWLDQNSKALSATIQALEVQKMTLATLRGMNFNMGEVANALKLKATDAMAAGMQMAGDAAAGAAGAAGAMGAAAGAAKGTEKDAEPGKPEGEAPAKVIDPLQWWGAITQQFQQIATDALKDAARNTAVDTARNMAAGVAKDAFKNAAAGVASAVAPRNKPARKTAAPKTARRAASKTAAKSPRKSTKGSGG